MAHNFSVGTHIISFLALLLALLLIIITPYITNLLEYVSPGMVGACLGKTQIWTPRSIDAHLDPTLH